MCKANRITCGCYCCRFRAELKIGKNMRRKESWKSQRQKKKMESTKGAPREFLGRAAKISLFEGRAAPVRCRAAASALKAQKFCLKALASKRKRVLESWCERN